MTITTKPYNPFDYLERKEEVNDYLNNAYMDDDPKVFLVALGYLAKKQGMAKGIIGDVPVKLLNKISRIMNFTYNVL
jgi:DNA-binding phage protein